MYIVKLTTDASITALGVLSQVNAQGGDGQAQLTWTPVAQDDQTGPSGQSNDPPSVFSYTVAYTPYPLYTDPQDAGGLSNGPPPVTDYEPNWSNALTQTVSSASATITKLAAGQQYAFRVRAETSEQTGAWSDTVYATINAEQLALSNPFPDLEMDNSATHDIDMANHFSGDADAYIVMVTTTHKRTGQVRTKLINTVARNKVRGIWNDDVLTLTAGPRGLHILTLDVTAKDVDGNEVSGDFQLTVGSDAAQSLAAQALANALASQARAILEDVSTVIGRRTQVSGTDTLTAFANLYGDANTQDECPLDTPLHECSTQSSLSDNQANAHQIDLANFRERVKSQGFAINLNAPPPDADRNAVQLPADALALTFWGQGSPTGESDTLFWGLDMSRGDKWTTGLAFAESTTQATQYLQQADNHVAGFAESDIAAVYPYIRTHLNDSTEVWSTMGLGSGQVDSTWTTNFSLADEFIYLNGDADFSLGLVGAEQTLYEQNGLEFSALGDAGWSRIEMTSGLAEGTEATIYRTRLGLAGRYTSESLIAGINISTRTDGGDGDTAAGTEFLSDIKYTRGRAGIGLTGRWYDAETATADHGTQGIEATLELTPRARSAGFGLSLVPGWGTQGGADKQDSMLATLNADYIHNPQVYLRGRASYGTLFANERTTPYTEFSLTEDGTRHLRAGLTWDGPVHTSFALERREDRYDTEHGIVLRLNTQF